jgi:tryptophanyl-tRNA synthetase
MLFTLDEDELKELHSKCVDGDLLCGQCKKQLITKINKFLIEYREKREKAKDSLDEYLLKENVDLRSMLKEI